MFKGYFLIMQVNGALHRDSADGNWLHIRAGFGDAAGWDATVAVCGIEYAGGERAIPELAEAYLKEVKQAPGVEIERATNLIYVTGTLPNGGKRGIGVDSRGKGY
ncbi:MAG: hypothetical protein ABSE62_02695 [Chthoniobacteraceae bacterium]|jgi:hypothetical protein